MCAALKTTAYSVFSGFILLYVVYVLVVVIGRYFHTRNRNRTSPNGNIQNSQDSKFLNFSSPNARIFVSLLYTETLMA